MLHSCFRVLYISDEQERNKTPHKYAKDRIRCHPLTKRAHLAEQTGAPRIMHTRKDTRAHLSACQKRMRTRGAKGGVGRTPGSAEPALPPVQVHFEEESWPRHLITFHICIWRELTSTSINRSPSHPSQHTHTSHSTSPRRLSLSLALLAR